MRLLDAYSGAGGAGMGYHLAGYEVVGVDIAPQPNYPFEFHQGNALEYVFNHYWEFDAIHASPPCHDHSSLRSLTGSDGTGGLLEETREILAASGIPYVIENVAGANMPGAIILCGSQFDLGAQCRDGTYRQLRRHRKFESNLPITPPGLCAHDGQPVGVYGNGGGEQYARGYKGTKQERFDAMGIDWMSHKEVAQAIPPAFTQHVGQQLLALSMKEIAA